MGNGCLPIFCRPPSATLTCSCPVSIFPTPVLRPAQRNRRGEQSHSPPDENPGARPKGSSAPKRGNPVPRSAIDRPDRASSTPRSPWQRPSRQSLIWSRSRPMRCHPWSKSSLAANTDSRWITGAYPRRAAGVHPLISVLDLDLLPVCTDPSDARRATGKAQRQRRAKPFAAP